MTPDKAAIAGSLSGIDNLLLHRTRLGVCVLLASSEAPISFSELKELLEETDGNLGSHLRKLEEAGYIELTKSFVNRKPLTVYTLTPTGRGAVDNHLRLMNDLQKTVK